MLTRSIPIKKNYIYAIITVLIWSTMAAMVKKMLYDIPNWEALSVSSVFAFLFLLIVNLKNGAVKELKKYSAKDDVIVIINLHLSAHSHQGGDSYTPFVFALTQMTST